jgi:hypothetical protein
MELDLKQFIKKKYGENTEVLRVKKDMHQKNMNDEIIFVIQFFIEKQLKDTKESEWIHRYREGREKNSGHLCICTHDIFNICEIEYIPLNITFIVGSECVKKNLPDLYLYTKEIHKKRKKVVKELKQKQFEIKYKAIKELKIFNECILNKQKVLNEILNLFKPKLLFISPPVISPLFSKIFTSSSISTSSLSFRGPYDFVDKWICYFPKYKGKTYKEVFNTDRKYCLWLLNCDKLKLNDTLKKYLEYKFKNT